MWKNQHSEYEKLLGKFEVSTRIYFKKKLQFYDTLTKVCYLSQ